VKSLDLAHEQGNIVNIDLPEGHLEKGSDIKTLNEAGSKFYEDHINGSPGIEGEWRKLAGTGLGFTEAYEQYITNGSKLKETNSEVYDFLKDHVFYGREYEALSKTHDIVTLPDGSRGYITGEPLKWKETLDHSQGHNEYNFKGTCGLCSCVNVLRESGLSVTENDIVSYAVEHHLCNVTSDVYTSGGTSAEDISKILKDHGVPAHADYNASTGDIANAIDEGKGVIVTVNAGLLWNDVHSFETGASNHAITVTGVCHDTNGNVKGFYICDSGRRESSDGARFISSDDFKEAYDCRGTCAVITDNQIKES
jgi:hypothetical protein